MKDPRQIIAAVVAAQGKIVKTGPDGMAFVVTHTLDRRDWQLCVIVSWGGHWDHASVHADRMGVDGTHMQRIPAWEEMEFVKRLCWQDDEWALEYHPSISEYKNDNPSVLHIWKPQTKSFPKPPRDFV